ncbi:hypothetical protein GCM10011519_16390 [Marmoricola endophyticus]|uniref:Uncharacterized protein n=1 Tax=Marmoricola endophyticus TaxID=2040280 RepID=A0A917F1H8_9ACTN|nr:hypothetical protein [Marmoricola endophyticus]GGF43220.1 hypothetical protein GCM10011519_16390 [Marmoricola endophyticus]
MSEPSDENPETEDASEDQDSGGSTGVGAVPDAEDVDAEAIEEERERRLDPENRPENVEIDNTQRDFDSEKGMFEDSEGYDEAEAKFDDDAM